MSVALRGDSVFAMLTIKYRKFCYMQQVVDTHKVILFTGSNI